MHRTLERLDAAASTLVPLAYLAGLVGGTMAYFTGLRVGFGLAVGIALAVASELHSFLQQRRTRAAWGILNRTAPDDVRYASLRRQVWAGAVMLAALLLFQTFTSVAFVAETWTPARGYLPAWLQVGIRGAVVPFLLLLAGFLAPLTVDASAVLSRASGDMLHKAIRATVKQWDHRIDHARRHGLDLAPVAISLMLDAGDVDGARRIELIAHGLNVAEGIAPALPAHATASPVASEPAIAGKTPPAIAAPASASTGAHTSAHPAPDRDRPPTGPGAPTVAPVVPSPDEPDTNSGQLPAAWPWKTPPDEPEDPAEPPLLPAASALAPTDLRAARKMATEAARRARAFALLDADPRMSRKTLRKELRCSAQRANEVYAEWHHERIRQHTRQHANAAAQ